MMCLKPSDKGGETVAKFFCWLLGHKYTISCIDAHYRHTQDQCERCGVILPLGYPYHRYYKGKQ
jgi:hypothetical protein